ncbi:DUF2844 domain-containing protein [Massilia sp. 9096]|uniref:DUF2844 domain-containing protein n=1 Tax=Massilia sp. 9096 TaxID=1500894 RepID=UPI00055A99BB|nr:DUF2844 domain-containing protein [Massilia sp. 9096]
MKLSSYKHGLRMMATGLLATVSLACHASLGHAPTSFPDTASSQAVRARALAAGSASAVNYNVNSTTLTSGTVVREYVGSDGTVFAVSWNGPFIPDLRTLLGDQFQTLTSAAASRPMAGHSQLHIDRADVTIESTGHMRAYAGRAWIKAKLPAGFNVQDIQ